MITTENDASFIEKYTITDLEFVIRRWRFDLRELYIQSQEKDELNIFLNIIIGKNL